MSDASEQAAFERILEYLRQTRGFDFTAYKRASLMRRVLKRMEAAGIDGFEAYLDYLQVHPDEFAALFNTILINVTAFFRDAEVWDEIAATVIPTLLAARGPDDPIRVWSAGAASGQEAYSVAMLLAERLGPDAYRDRVKIYATDADEPALMEARQAIYTEKQVEGVPEVLREKYFDRAAGSYTFKRELRRGVIFGRHDLIQDAPISRVDLLLCRNTLMYFNADVQTHIIAKFYFSLNPGGFLVLGHAEMLSSHTALFQPVDIQRRIFKTAQKDRQRERQAVPGPPAAPEVTKPVPNEVTRLRDMAFDTSADAQVVVDAAGTLVSANASARRLFGLSAADTGRPLHTLDVSSRPVELRAGLDRVRDDRRDVIFRAVPWEHAGAARILDVVIAPLSAVEGTLLGARVTFRDVTAVKTLQDQLAHSRQELETAYEALQSTNEELETTNEELQSTVEELETTNEELQSTNEELETMNEELQSTNEELQTMNDELRFRGLELGSAKTFLESVFSSLRSAVVVLDRDLRVLVWNAGATDLWGLRAEEAEGEYFFGLEIGLPVKDLHAPVGEVLNGRAAEGGTIVPATSRKGRALNCRVTVAPLIGLDRAVTGAILVMDENVPAV
jgi:two-component system CheB/CheR fusion protein